jgi:hypothetical protein
VRLGGLFALSGKRQDAHFLRVPDPALTGKGASTAPVALRTGHASRQAPSHVVSGQGYLPCRPTLPIRHSGTQVQLRLGVRYYGSKRDMNGAFFYRTHHPKRLV